VWRAQILLLFFAVLFFVSTAFSQDLTALSKTLRSGNSEERRDALMTLRSMHSEDASRIAAAGLSDDTPIVRATAASSVVFLPKAEAVAALSPLLSDKDEFVRREGAFALGEVGDASAGPLLVRAMQTDKSLEVRSAATAALGKTGDPEVVSPLVAIFQQKPNEDNEMMRRAAARSIGQIAQIMRSGKTEVVTPQNFLPEKYKDIDSRPSPDLSSHFKSAVGVLVRVLESSSEADDTRREAAFALGAIGDRSAESTLAKYTSSSDVYLAQISKEALLKLRAVE
jgi:HEAT repeat protein